MYQGILNAVKTRVLPSKDIELIIPNGTAIQNARTSCFQKQDLEIKRFETVTNPYRSPLFFRERDANKKRTVNGRKLKSVQGGTAAGDVEQQGYF